MLSSSSWLYCPAYGNPAILKATGSDPSFLFPLDVRKCGFSWAFHRKVADCMLLGPRDTLVITDVRAQFLAVSIPWVRCSYKCIEYDLIFDQDFKCLPCMLFVWCSSCSSCGAHRALRVVLIVLFVWCSSCSSCDDHRGGVWNRGWPGAWRNLLSKWRALSK